MSDTPRTREAARMGFIEGNESCPVFVVPLKVAEELERELAQRTAERDEARQRCCIALDSTGVWRQPRMDLPGGAWTPKLIAQELGWDCFEKEVQK